MPSALLQHSERVKPVNCRETTASTALIGSVGRTSLNHLLVILSCRQRAYGGHQISTGADGADRMLRCR